MLPCKELRRAPIFYLGRGALSRGTFFLQQLSLALQSPSVPAELTTLANDAMTGNQQRHAIVGARGCDRAHCTRSADRLCDLAVRSRLPARDSLKLAPHLPLKRGSLNIEWNVVAPSSSVDCGNDCIDPGLELTR